MNIYKIYPSAERRQILRNITRKKMWLLHHACGRFWWELFEEWAA